MELVKKKICNLYDRSLTDEKKTGLNYSDLQFVEKVLYQTVEKGADARKRHFG